LNTKYLLCTSWVNKVSRFCLDMVLFFQMIIIQNKDNKTQKIEGNCGV